MYGPHQSQAEICLPLQGCALQGVFPVVCRLQILARFVATGRVNSGYFHRVSIPFFGAGKSNVFGFQFLGNPIGILKKLLIQRIIRYHLQNKVDPPFEIEAQIHPGKQAGSLLPGADEKVDANRHKRED